MHTMTERKIKSGTIDVKALLAGDEEFLRGLVRTALQEVLEVEMTEALGAEKSERTAGRLGYRSGYYGRTLDWQARAARPAGPSWAVLHRIVRALSTLRASASGGAGRDVGAGGFNPESEGDHRGVVRSQLLGLVDQCNQPAPG